MSKQDLLMIIRNLSDRIEQADKDVKIILKKRKYFRNAI